MRTGERAQILVMAKQPRAGFVKTRLIPRYGADGAAALADAALRDTLDAVAAGTWARRTLALDGSPDDLLPQGFEHLPQRGAGLDERIAAACDDAYRALRVPVVVIGGDTPQVTPLLLADAAARLARPGIDAVLGPASDGGYWLLGLRAPAAHLIEGIPMSQSNTGAAQLGRMRASGLRVDVLVTLTDVDTPGDVDLVAAEAPNGRFAAVADALGERVGAPVI